MRRVGRLAGWFVCLEAVWMAFIGTTQSTEIVAGAIASAIVVAFVEVLRARGLLAFGGSPSMVARSWKIPHEIVFDFFLVQWLLLRALLQRRRVRGEWVMVPFPVADGPRGRFERALVATVENMTANGLVVDLDRGEALLHSLDTAVWTGTELV